MTRFRPTSNQNFRAQAEFHTLAPDLQEPMEGQVY